MAYTTISQLPEKLGLDILTTDEFLLSSGDRSYKVNGEELKNFIASVYNIDEYVLENKDITTISNTIHATAIHTRMLAGEAGLKRGDVVRLLPHDHEAMVAAGVPDLPVCVKADNREAEHPALGIVKIVYDGSDEKIDETAEPKSESELYDNVVIISQGIFTPFDTSVYGEDGKVLWLGQEGQLTLDKPVNTEGEGGYVIQQACAYTLFTCPADDPEHTGALLVSFGNPEQHAHDVFFNGWEYNNERYDLESRDVESAIAEVFYRSSQKMVTLEYIEIVDDSITIPSGTIDGDTIYGSARIFDSNGGLAYDEVTCEVGPLYNTVEFDPADNLNGKFATVAYLAAYAWTGEEPWDPSYT